MLRAHALPGFFGSTKGVGETRGVLTAVFRDAKAGCCEADASTSGGARILPMRLTAVARLTALNAGRLAATTRSTACSRDRTTAAQIFAKSSLGDMVKQHS